MGAFIAPRESASVPRMSAPGEHGAPSDDDLASDEPRTPLWLPLLGLTLFVLVGLWMLAGKEPETATGAAPEGSAAPAASANH